jgi:hypothetical protein
MKMKSFAVCAISGFIAASFGLIAPAMADDAANGQNMQAPADTQMPNSSMPSNNNNSATNPDNDDSTPDTATGDDDY